MARRISSSTQALLGLLTIEPRSGYDLGRMVRASIGHIWSESYGQIYPNLKRLAARGLVDFKTEKHKGRPDRRIYSITKTGREQLASWLSVPPQPEIPRNEMLLKLFFGAQAPIDKNPQYPDAPFWKMAERFGQMEMEAHLRWAEETLHSLRKLAGQEKSFSEDRKGKRYARR
jgi:DNA-binding PadR family transcriptional regulator